MGAAVFLFGCCAIATTRKPMSIVEVAIDLYSGRENPAWRLKGADAARFLALIAALPNDGGNPPPMPEGLGYRGLCVTVTSEGATQRFVIAGGRVIAESAGTTDLRNLRDPDRALEKWLLRTGEEQLGSELLEHLLAN